MEKEIKENIENKGVEPTKPIEKDYYTKDELNAIVNEKISIALDGFLKGQQAKVEQKNNEQKEIKKDVYNW